MEGFREIPCVIKRGGTSKAVFIHAKDLPEDKEVTKKVILAIFGSPDKRQIDGLGGADPLTSKVAIVGPSDRQNADVDYTFGAVDINEPIVDFNANCGNVISAVGPFAIDEGLVEADSSETIVNIYNTNTKKILKAYVPTERGKTKYLGDYAIDGVPGTGAKILIDLSSSAGSVTGKLLPTGNPVDVVQIPTIGEISISIVDAGNPTCFIKPDVLGFSGLESPMEKKVIQSLDKIELIRGYAAKMIGMVADPTKSRMQSPAIPLLAIVSEPSGYHNFLNDQEIRVNDIDLVSRLFYMQEMHKTYPGTGTVCTGVAAMIEGTLVNLVTAPRARDAKKVLIGHPSGVISVDVDVVNTGEGWNIRNAAYGRTARRIMKGFVYVPEKIFAE